jgi:GNAT superfamily N-acetyltransferase
MADQVNVARLKEEQIESAADLMTRVFFEQLDFVSFETTEEQRQSYRDGYLRVVRYAYVHAEPYAATVEDKVVGLALWLPPHALTSEKEEQVEFGVQELTQIFQESLGHLYSLGKVLDETVRRELRQPFWFMPSRLDIDPEYRGRGVASALVRPVLLRADEGKVPCYVETILEPMVSFFCKKGFEIRAEGIDPSNGTRYWALWREPRQV